MFLPRLIIELESLLSGPLPAALRSFLARRPQGTALGHFRAYPRALVLAQYRERINTGTDPLLLPVGRNTDGELLVHLKEESVWLESEGKHTKVADNFTAWLKAQRALHRQANDKKLVRAARAGDVARVERLLRRGTDINEQDATGNTPLMAALLAWQYEASSLLLKHQPDLSIADASGHTALMWAAYRNQPLLVQQMIAQGADVHARTASGEGLLYFAVTGPRSVTEGGGKGSREVVEILITAGLRLTEPQLPGDRPVGDLGVEAEEGLRAWLAGQ
ncbi:MAG: ankyrin repeat domain-containing protein [Chitinophagaceae bacterium]|nr:MAG: ankyrin repeat domain-containing protein [Chitinophagaceae bacterium]